MEENISPLPYPESSLSSLPKNPEEFDADHRISFSKISNKFILETEDGQEYEFDDALRRWVPVLDDALLEKQREAYAVKGVDENEPVKPAKKRKNEQEDDTHNGTSKHKKTKGPNQPHERKKTAIYVTSIPLDADEDEVHYVFSKCGVIAEEIDSSKPRIKMYKDEAGKFKGDALIVYFRPESVDLAIQMLDDSDFRLGVQGPAGKMKVQMADSSYKKQQEAPAKPNVRDKKKIIKRTQKLNHKLADWDDDDPSTLQETSSRWDKVVILKHMFTLQELEEDPNAILDIEEDIRDECSKLGDVTNVVIFDKEHEGIASVRFSNSESAKACVTLMDGRFFSGTKVEAYTADGPQRFRKSGDNHGGDDEKEDERLEKFGEWLEGKTADDGEKV